MKTTLKRQRIAILVLSAMMAGSLLIHHISIETKNREIQTLEKINFELQANSDKLQEINDTYYNRIVNQQNQIQDMKDTLDRVLTLSSAEVDKLQAVVMSETRGSSLQDAMAVTQTILDRSTQWNKSGSDVMSASGQYAKPYEGAVNDTVRMAFKLIYIDGYRVFQDPTTHFYNEKICSPEWAKAKVLRGVIRNHAYYF